MAFAILDIDTSKLKDNIDKIKTQIPTSTKLLLIAKANAYGLGAIDICEQLDSNIDYIGVATLNEALELRHANIRKPILLLSESHPNEWSKIIDHNITMTIYEKETIIALDNYVTQCKKHIRTHLKIDTGMTRLGAHWETAKSIIDTWKSSSKYVIKEGIYSHFANSDSDHALNLEQLNRFKSTTSQLDQTLRHIANSDGVSNVEHSHFDLVRIGLNVYQNSFTLHAPIKLIKFAKKGTEIGYGGTYVTQEDCKIAIIGIGYADGISTQYSNNGTVSINNGTYPIVGKICMDMFMVKLPATSTITCNDNAMIICPDDESGTTLTEMAKKTNQNPREIMTRFSQRITRNLI